MAHDDGDDGEEHEAEHFCPHHTNFYQSPLSDNSHPKMMKEASHRLLRGTEGEQRRREAEGDDTKSAAEGEAHLIADCEDAAVIVAVAVIRDEKEVVGP